jgi:regulator of replication initiation timing
VNAQLKDAQDQIADLQQTVEELLRTKRTVEQSVVMVLEDNEELAKEIDRVTACLECERLKSPSVTSMHAFSP